MRFPYGISLESLSRWLAFESICAFHAERGRQVSWPAIEVIVDAELEAIERATLERDQLEQESAL